MGNWSNKATKTQKVIAESADIKWDQEDYVLSLKSQKDNWIKILKIRDWSALRKLMLNNCQIDGNKISQLMKINLPQLKSLVLSANPIKDNGLKHILSKQKNSLEQLWLRACSISFKGIKSMLNTNMSNLIKLGLSQNNIGNHGAKLLIKIDLKYLEILFIDKCMIENQGMMHLSKCNWPNLKRLYISHNLVQTDGHNEIQQHCSWKYLKQLSMTENYSIFSMSRIHCQYYLSHIHNTKDNRTNFYPQPTNLSLMKQIKVTIHALLFG